MWQYPPGPAPQTAGPVARSAIVYLAEYYGDMILVVKQLTMYNRLNLNYPSTPGSIAMNNLSELEKRIRILEDIEAIKKLKAKYWNSVDRKQWQDLAACLTGDCSFDSPQLHVMEGREYIVKVLQRAMRGVITAHQGHNPQIEILTETTAKGRWALNDRVEMSNHRYFRGYGHYEDEYLKQDDQWKIRKSKLSYIFQEIYPEPPRVIPL
jgi:hypothetical protein